MGLIFFFYDKRAQLMIGSKIFERGKLVQRIFVRSIEPKKKSCESNIKLIEYWGKIELILDLLVLMD